jgi:hypothetical protein
MREGPALLRIVIGGDGGIGAPTNEQIAGHRRLAFDLDHAALAEFVAVSQTFVRSLGDLDRAGLGVGFHAAGGGRDVVALPIPSTRYGH